MSLRSAALVLMFLVGACASQDATPPTLSVSVPEPSEVGVSEGAETTDRTPEPTSTTTTVLDDYWSNPDLPRPATDLVAVENRVVYETVEDGHTRQIMIDAATGTVVRDIETDPAGKVEGVLFSPIVDEDRDLVFHVDIALRRQQGVSSLHASDLDGQILWSQEFFWPNPPTWCDDNLCVKDWDGSLYELDPATGEILRTAVIEDLRFLARYGDVEVYPQFTEVQLVQTEGLVAYRDFGFEEVWRIDGATLAAAAGHEVTPDTGWAGTHDPVQGVIGLTLGAPAPNGFGQENPDWETRNVGAAFGIDAETGEVLWGRPNMMSCGSPGLFVCPWLETVAIEPNQWTDVAWMVGEVIQLDIATGEELWSYQLDEPVDYFDLTVVLREDRISIGVLGQETIHLDRPYVAAVDDPLPANRTRPRRDYFVDVPICPITAWDGYGLDAPWEGTAERTFAVGPTYAPCDTSGSIQDPLDVLRDEGGLPFGAGVRADGWWLWVDEDGVIHGARP